MKINANNLLGMNMKVAFCKQMLQLLMIFAASDHKTSVNDK
jgi:hypothetical protein